MQPPSTIQQALVAHRIEIQAIFHEGLELAVIAANGMSPPPRSREVAILAHFFLTVPAIQSALNAALKRTGVSATVKGVFGHHSGKYGPVVDFYPTEQPGCELCDMMFIVTYGGEKGEAAAFGNATFFQAKVARSKVVSGRSSRRQAELYANAKDFIFRDPDRYKSGLDEPSTRGSREMPRPSGSGFCFWSFDPRSRPPDGWHWPWHASAVIEPPDFKDESNDRSFGEALYCLMAGHFGLPVAVPKNHDFGWNRIVHDFLLRAANDPLGYTYGVVHASDIRRYQAHPSDAVGTLLEQECAIVSNPFDEFFGLFESKALSEVAAAYSDGKAKTDPSHLDELLQQFRGHREQTDHGEREPPDDDIEPGPEDSGGSGSFIRIDLRAG